MQNTKSTQISFEFFPPKSVEAMTLLQTAAQALAQCHPNFFSVTYGAGGTTRTGTIDTLKMLHEYTDINVAPHLSCIGSTRAQLMEMLLLYKSLGARRLVALRGDLPAGIEQAGEFKYASDLVALIREVTGNYFHIDVAAYPETHPQADSPAADILHLKRKCEAGADSAITQYFFNADAYFYYLDECARHGISMPIIPGIMPITQFSRLARFSEMCGAEIPLWIRKRLQSYGDDLESIKAFGIEVVHSLCESLLLGGAPGLHFYTLNKSDVTLDIIDMLGYSSSTQLKVTA